MLLLGVDRLVIERAKCIQLVDGAGGRTAVRQRVARLLKQLPFVVAASPLFEVAEPREMFLGFIGREAERANRGRDLVALEIVKRRVVQGAIKVADDNDRRDEI